MEANPSRMRSLSFFLLGLSVFAQAPEMATIPAVDCPMGPTRSHEEIHKPKVRGFLMALTPVTNAQYKLFLDATNHRAPERNSFDSKYRLWTGRMFPPEIANQPVVNVSWTDAAAYCKWLSQTTGKSFRLPTEEEWEVAARGGQAGKPYPTGDAIDLNAAWFGQKWNGPSTLKAANYGKPNGYGLFGMAGNVWQWVEDWYVPVFNDRPVAEELQLYRVLRGGSWANDPDFLKVNYRSFHPPEFRDLFAGFRVAASLPD